MALHHHGSRLKHGHGDLRNGQLLMVGLLGGDDRSVGREHEVDARVRHQVGLELRDVHVQGSIEAKAGREGADDLGNETVQVGVGRPLNVQVPAHRARLSKATTPGPAQPKSMTRMDKAPAANVVQRLVVVHNRHISVLQQRVDAQHLGSISAWLERKVLHEHSVSNTEWHG